MAVHADLVEKTVIRQRKAHRKSRAGCQNCKLRRVKCDEGKPSCTKCIVYGVSCNSNDGAEGVMRSNMAGTFQVELRQDQVPSIDETITSLVRCPPPIRLPLFPKNELFDTLSSGELDLLDKFQNRTILTLGTNSGMPVYRREVMRLASSAPYLLHIVMTLTLMHDRQFTTCRPKKQSSAEVYHWMRGTSLLNKALARPSENDRDALWASAALLGAIAFGCIDAQTPEEAWPLRKPSSNDLEWLRMSDGKKEVWKIAQPCRKDSAFGEDGRQNLMDFITIASEDPDPRGIPREFVELFNIEESSNRQTNPYHSPVAILSRLLPIECNSHTLMKFLGFISFAQPDFKKLLEEKDPRALLLLAYWFGSVIPYNQWWLTRRAQLECRAICIYLHTYHYQEVRILKLLHYPRKMCGLGDS